MNRAKEHKDPIKRTLTGLWAWSSQKLLSSKWGGSSWDLSSFGFPQPQPTGGSSLIYEKLLLFRKRQLTAILRASIRSNVTNWLDINFLKISNILLLNFRLHDKISIRNPFNYKGILENRETKFNVVGRHSKFWRNPNFDGSLWSFQLIRRGKSHSDRN